MGIEKVLGRLMELKGERDKLLSRQSLLHRPHHDDGFAKKIQIIFLDKKLHYFPQKLFCKVETMTFPGI